MNELPQKEYLEEQHQWWRDKEQDAKRAYDYARVRRVAAEIALNDLYTKQTYGEDYE